MITWVSSSGFGEAVSRAASVSSLARRLVLETVVKELVVAVETLVVEVSFDECVSSDLLVILPHLLSRHVWKQRRGGGG